MTSYAEQLVERLNHARRRLRAAEDARRSLSLDRFTSAELTSRKDITFLGFKFGSRNYSEVITDKQELLAIYDALEVVADMREADVKALEKQIDGLKPIVGKMD